MTALLQQIRNELVRRAGKRPQLDTEKVVLFEIADVITKVIGKEQARQVDPGFDPSYVSRMETDEE